MALNKDDILLESGTNELEVIMFGVGEGLFGINVLKVREIINPLPIVAVPNSHKYVEGIINLRDEVIPVINLAHVLNIKNSKTPEQDKFIVTELNQVKIAFRVHHILRIHRCSWEDIEKPDELSSGQQTYAIGYSKIEEDVVILLDFEKVIVEINPQLGVNVEKLKELGERERSEKQLVIAEDSAVLRHLLKDTLEEAGYHRLKLFENGQEAWEYLHHLSSEENINPIDEVNLIITDIEMPQMDGHHLTEKVKSNSRLKDIPVIIFSSLITDDLFHKGETVGASAQVSKPQIVDLVQTIDKYIL